MSAYFARGYALGKFAPSTGKAYEGHWKMRVNFRTDRGRISGWTAGRGRGGS